MFVWSSGKPSPFFCEKVDAPNVNFIAVKNYFAFHTFCMEKPPHKHTYMEISFLVKCI